MDGTGAQAQRPQLVITVNGPGEIAAWLYPLTVAVKRARPDIRICVCLLPCVFSSGAERGVLSGMDGIDAVADVRESFAIILRNRLPQGFRRDAPTLVFHLGGEMALTVAIAWRLKAGLYGYAEDSLPWQWRFRRLFFSGLNPVPKRFADDPGALVGELMVDAATLRRQAAGADPGNDPVIGLFPGSRDYMVRPMLPYMAAMADRLAAARPGLRFVMAKSDFVDWDVLRRLAPPAPDLPWEAHAVRLVEDAGPPWLETQAGLRIDILANAEVLARADLAVSLPGTNTGEMAAAGIPPVVVLPTQMADANAREIPLPGLAGHIGRLPLIGPALQRFAAHQLLARTPILAIPNRRAGRVISPELVGAVTPAELAGTLGDLLDGDLDALSAEVRGAMGRAGAADRLAREIDGYFAAA